MEISILIPTYNPDHVRLNKTLEGLRAQTLHHSNWELIIIDNNSSKSFESAINLSWHTNARIVRESNQGLTFARLKGFEEAKSNMMILVDDDNILSPTYIEEALIFMNNHPEVGSVGGKSIANYEDFEPEYWSLDFLPSIAVRNLGNEVMISENTFNHYPTFAPIGAGMVIRANVLHQYIDQINNSKTQITDRTGNSLASGGDNEINIFVLKQGYAVAYDPELILQHIIPQIRLTKDYLARLNYESSASWVKLLSKHQICPWKPIHAFTLYLRFLKAYFSFKAWESETSYIRWKGACGTFKGQSEIG